MPSRNELGSGTRADAKSPASILLVDDDDDFRVALSELLREDGHAVEAYGSLAALPPVSELGKFAALITDHHLGDGETGLSFAERFNAAHPDVPVILVTAFASTYVGEAIAARPNMSLLRKPLRYEDLHRLLGLTTSPRALSPL
jgi:DNA-binding NtrC family response regulator